MNRCAGSDLFGALVAMAGVGLICARLLSFNGWLAFLGGVAIAIGAASAAFSNVLLESEKDSAGPVDAGRVADDFRNGTAARFSA